MLLGLILFSASLVLSLDPFKCENPFVYDESKKLKFDFSGLEKTFTINSENGQFHFNPCTLAPECDKKGYFCSTLGTSGSKEIKVIGKDLIRAKYLSKGNFVYEFIGEELQENKHLLITTVELTCNNGNDELNKSFCELSEDKKPDESPTPPPSNPPNDKPNDEKDKSPENDAPKGGMSGGDIFLIIFFVIAGVYFLGGALIRKQNGYSGIEIIPHFQFWSKVPSLMKDGVNFLAERLCGGTSHGYQAI
ncbi:hypothetical protein ROZALSC1DRAFT_29586 [Rozella allomycis CSF55]|uniref:Uncharacterized protein n=1 Tax=Rozella allomycis (strain CSF55) TaxID=988480 RepID=A0A075AX66_ROZAC|nr:hypothetical protein O9G_001729 [Rozella allomycis CSF55]RKP18759.1 hypothetical protein ROZALSC1DRAFT_29586 [Rozella allomycis CSF55]|eukprot:EPZ33317.1 hypothetical protein O9G_001729 [Rozella allomycis CSF55]